MQTTKCLTAYRVQRGNNDDHEWHAATEALPEGTIIGYAAGEVIKQDTLQQRLVQYHNSGYLIPPHLWFPVYGTSKYVIWCGEIANAMSYLCPPANSQQSNVELISDPLVGGLMGFRTVRAIASGESIIWARDEVSTSGEPLHRCAQCYKVHYRMQMCSSCRLTCYCSADHQRLHWPSHKLECPRPPETSFRPMSMRHLRDGTMQ